MALGVTESHNAESHPQSKILGKLQTPKGKKIALLGGLAGGAYLLLSHGNKQASGSGSSAQDQLDAQSQLIAAEEASYANPVAPAGAQPVTSGGGDIVSKGKSPAVIVNVRANAGGGAHHPKHKPKPKPKPKRPGKHHPLPRGGGTGKLPKPKSGHRGKPAPAGRDGRHPSTRKKTPSGARKSSPALVESVRGQGDGAVILGREFPGAVSHTIGGPARSHQGGRVVTVNYGGRTDRHIALPDGTWVDQAPGLNPPSRGVPSLASRRIAR